MENKQDIRLYFDKVDVPPLYATYMDEAESLKNSLVNEKYNVAIIGVKNEAGTVANNGCAMAPNTIRKHLYALRGGYKNLRIADLGNLKPGKNENDNKFALEDVIDQLTSNGIVCIVIGGSQDLTTSMYNGLKNSNKEINLAIMDARADVRNEKKADTNSSNYLNRIINDKQLQNMDIVGYQNYYIGDGQMSCLSSRNLISNQYRLGLVRQDLIVTEPVFRDADLVSIDMCVVRQSDAPGNCSPSPNGLFGEEACQLMRLVGSSDRVKAIGLFEANPEYDNNDQTSQLAAQMIWHALEALDKRCMDYPMQPISNYQKFIVPCGDMTFMTFYYGKTRNRWWMKIPMQDGERIMACSERDYNDAKSGNTPDIWFRYYMN